MNQITWVTWLDSTMAWLLWNYLGIFYAMAAAWLFTRLRPLLRGRGRLKGTITVAIRIMAGHGSQVLLLYHSTTVEFFHKTIDCLMVVRLLIAIPFIVFYPLAFGLLSDNLFRWYCPPWAVMYTALLTAATFEGYHVWWHWLKGALDFFFFAYS